jgi:hypothetical protein
MIVNHVFPEFTSPHGYLRARACWVINQFAEVKYKDPANLQRALELARTALCNDSELPVRVEAAITVQMLLTEQENGSFLKWCLRNKTLNCFLLLSHS